MFYNEIGYYISLFNYCLWDRVSCYGYCLLYGCDWYDGFMIDLFVSEREINEVFLLEKMEFEGFVFLVLKNWSGIL